MEILFKQHMKKLLSVLMILWLIAPGVQAQVTITKNDMPQAGDTLRVSMTNIVPGDFTKTAYDTTWDFSLLTPVTQRVESYVAVSTVPPEYWFVFIPSIVSNLAAPGNTNLPVPGFPVTDSYTFYNNVNGGFSDVGNASKVSGIPLELKYDVPDLIYPFPLSPGMTWSSSSFAGVSIPSMAYISNSRTRSSIVDGWGTLITPIGSFSTLRVKCDLVQSDSVSVDSFGINLPFTRSITQYKWLAAGEGIPVLQVNVELNLVSAMYRDIYRPGINPMTVNLGPDTSVAKGQPITLTAAVTNGVAPFRYVWGNFDTTSSITLVIDSTITTGVAVFDALNNIAFDMITISVKYAPGIQEQTAGLLKISPNPASGNFTITLPGHLKEGTLIVRDIAGREVFSQAFTAGSGTLGVSSEGLRSGCYYVTVRNGEETSTGKLIIK
jgi:hypothetical protein